MLGRGVIGGRRLVGTGYLRCKECGVQFKPNTPHPEFDHVVMLSGFPMNERCSHVGEVVPELHEFRNDREKYRWVESVSEWR